MKNYVVTIGFGSFMGCEMEYSVEADSREEAEELALKDAMDDLSVESIEEEDD